MRKNFILHFAMCGSLLLSVPAIGQEASVDSAALRIAAAEYAQAQANLRLAEAQARVAAAQLKLAQAGGQGGAAASASSSTGGTSTSQGASATATTAALANALNDAELAAAVNEQLQTLLSAGAEAWGSLASDLYGTLLGALRQNTAPGSETRQATEALADLFAEAVKAGLAQMDSALAAQQGSGD